MKLKNFYLNCISLLAIITLTYGCAKIVSPTGGPRDTTAPKVSSSNPPNGATDVNAKTLEIEFDELVKINNTGSILISPYTKEQPEYFLKGKKLIVKFPKELEENITYNINFKDNIRDVNESNIFQGFSYTFSTGSEIDSVNINGQLTDAQTKEPIKEAIIGVYEKSADSTFTKSPPLYIDITDENGNFSIKNIKKGTFELTALEDKNGNYFYDLPNESIGFTSDFLNINVDSTYKINLSMFIEKLTLKKTLNKEFSQGQLQVQFSQKIENLSTQIQAPSSIADSIYQIINDEQTEIRFYYSFNQQDSVSVTISGNDYLDTISLFSKKEYLPKPIELINKAGRGKTIIDSSEQLILTFNNYIQSINEDSLQLIEIDSIQNIINNNSQLLKESNQLSMNALWSVNKKYNFKILPGALTDLFNQTNRDTIFSEFTISKTIENGSIALKIKQDTINTHPYFYEIKDNADVLIDKGILNDTLIQILNIKPDNYKLEITEDKNANNKWDTGNYAERRQPEKIIQFNKKISVKQKFETEILIDLNELEN